MNIRKSRIICWALCLVLATALIVGEKVSKNIDTNTMFKGKAPITVCAPDDMKDAFKSALHNSGLNHDYKIVMTSDPNSNICVDYGKENDTNYTKFAFSPFVIAYSDNKNNFKKLKKSEVLILSEFNDDYYDIDFLQVVNEVIEDGSWVNLGIEDLKRIKVFYPSKETPYWNDFYDFMLVTVNKGAYPKSEEEFEKADETIQKFMESSNTEEVSNFDEKIERVGGFPENAFFILPEKTVYDLAIDHSKCTRIFYPTQTVYFNYYVKGDELGNKVISAFEASTTFYNFYSDLKKKYYRSHSHSELTEMSRLYDERNVYNVIKIPKNSGL